MSEMGSVTLIGDIVVPSGNVILDWSLDGKLIGNLEAPIGTNEKISFLQRPKAGSILRSHEIPQWFKGGIFCLANNHTMDFGWDGLNKTQEVCAGLDINYIGAGKDLSSAEKSYVYEKDGFRIGVLARCETQFGNATYSRAGVAPLNPTIYGSISKLKAETDVVIVSIHGAAELCPWPSPKWQDLLRSFIDAGASVVHGHHAHIPQGYEEYNNGLIFYGLGNFLVNPNSWRDVPNALWSIVVDIELSKKGVEGFSSKTSEIKEGQSVSVCESGGDEFALHQKYIDLVNRPLGNRPLLEGLWQEFSVRMYRIWNEKQLSFDSVLDWRKLKRRISYVVKDQYKRSSDQGWSRRITAAQSDYLLWHHLFACESHCDSIATALGVLGSELEDMRTPETYELADQLMSWSMGGDR